MQPLQICIGPTIRISRESWCLPYAGFLVILKSFLKLNKGEYSASLKNLICKVHFLTKTNILMLTLKD